MKQLAIFLLIIFWTYSSTSFAKGQHSQKGSIRVSVEAVIPAPSKSVWRIIGDFNGLEKFISSVEKSYVTGVGVGSIRFVHVIDTEQPVVEKLLHYNTNKMHFVYCIINSPLPVTNYYATMQIIKKRDEQKCIVRWSGRFDPKDGFSQAEAEQFIKDFYTEGLTDLQKLFTSKITKQMLIPVDPSTVWNIVRDFNAWHSFLPSISSSELIVSDNKIIRLLPLDDGSGIITEELDNLNNYGMSLSYSIIGSPLAFDVYTSTITVENHNGQSLVTWSGKFKPSSGTTEKEMLLFLENLYSGALENLKNLVSE